MRHAGAHACGLRFNGLQTCHEASGLPESGFEEDFIAKKVTSSEFFANEAFEPNRHNQPRLLAIDQTAGDSSEFA